MKRRLLFFLTLAFIITACTDPYYIPRNPLLGTDALPTTELWINTQQDTVLRTDKGAMISIAAGAIEGDSQWVQLQVKEAYKLEDMILAGLTTKTNGLPLSSGGMIYLNTTNTTRITRAIKVAIPTDGYIKGMELFKGFEDETGTVNWNSPDSISSAAAETKLEMGKRLFQANCAPCHHPHKDATGPALAWSAVYRDTAYLHAFTRNSAALIASGDPLANEMYNCWLKTAMTAFPNYTDEEMNAIYDYLRTEAYTNGNNQRICYEQCDIRAELNALEQKKADLIADNQKTQEPVYQNTMADGSTENGTAPKPIENLVMPEAGDVGYYQFSIRSWGWLNVDVISESLDGFSKGELVARIVGEYDLQQHVYFMVPSKKMFLDGGPLHSGRNKKDYAFYTDDGQIPLPIGADGYILSMGEKDGTILYGHTKFKISSQQTIEVQLKEVSKEEFEQQIRSICPKDIEATIKDSKNAKEIGEVDKGINILKDKLKEAEGVDCGCICAGTAKTTDSDSVSVESWR